LKGNRRKKMRKAERKKNVEWKKQNEREKEAKEQGD
jgi:hypothetical protein